MRAEVVVRTQFANCIGPQICLSGLWQHLVATERRLWLNLSNIKRKDKNTFGILRGPFCQPCHLVCFRARRSPASAYLRVHPKCSVLGMPTPSEEGFRAVSSDASCRFAVSGCRSVRTTTYKSRDQSREAVTSSRILTAWKLLPNISRWVLQTIEKGYQYSSGLARPVLWVCFPPR